MLCRIRREQLISNLLRLRTINPLSSCSLSSLPNKEVKNVAVDPLKDYTPFGGLNKKEKKDVFHYTDRKSGVGYSHYSNTVFQHRPYIWPPLRKLYNFNYLIVALGLVLIAIDYEGALKYLEDISGGWRPKASQLNNSSDRDEKSQVSGELNNDEEHKKETVEKSESESGEEKEKPKKKKIGFRERRIIEYEDRIRMYSTPDKIFRYFATLKSVDEKSGHVDIYMTPQDFLRSFTPGVMQPRKYGLDSYKLYHPEKYHHNFSDPESIFYKLGENGLINFSDYMFLMTLLSTSPKDFELAFRIFDINGDGMLDKEEFYKVQELVMSQTSVGQRHRDRIAPAGAASFKVETNSALERYFFGKDGQKSLSAEKFLQFQADLHRDVLKMEFSRRDALDGVDQMISELSFGQLLLLHAQIGEKRMQYMLKRVKRKFKGGPGISFDEVLNFFCFLYHIEEVDMALHFHRMAGASIDGKMLQRVAKKVTGVDISDHVVEVMIALFDDNMDGKLSNEEFVSVMRRRMRRGLERPRDTGFFRLVDAMWECGKRAYHDSPLPFY